MQRKRVFVTGMGTVNPLGLTVAETWPKLLAGESGVDRIRSFDPSTVPGMEVSIGGEVKGFDPINYMGKKQARRMDPVSQFAVAAAREAVAQAELKVTSENCNRIGVYVGTGVGGLKTVTQDVLSIAAKGMRGASPIGIPKLMPNAAAGNIAMEFGFRGASFGPTSACAAGADALGRAFLDLLYDEELDVIIAGGTEACIVPVAVADFEVMRALCKEKELNLAPKKASRPFDAKRAGFVMGEGAAILVLETCEHAQKRGANILAELAGYGASTDAFHITEPDPQGEGALLAMQMALRRAKVGMDELVYINAHGTSTPLNDRIETLAIKRLLGERAYNVPVSSTKSMTAHLVGAGGPLEAIICVRQIQTSFAPPTINYEFPDPECDLDYIPNIAREIGTGPNMSNSFGFGGHNSCLVFLPYE